MNDRILLDTCTILWLAENEPLADEGRAAIAAAEILESIYVSPISAWEIGLLVAKRRLALSFPVERWFDQFLAARGSQLASMPPKVLIDSAFLPGTPPDDPADCILAATAREYGLTLVTRDRRLLDYASEGHLRAVPC